MSELSSKSVITPSHITYAEHVVYDPFSKEDMEGNNIRKYIPVSPCNLIMYFLVMVKEAEMYYLLRYLLLKDQERDEPNMEYETPEIPRPRRRAILSEVGADINVQLNCANPSRTLYATFVKQLLTEGSIKWRQHQSSVDICVMNDYHPTTGYLMSQSFVHVSCTNEDGTQESRKLHCHLVKSLFPILH